MLQFIFRLPLLCLILLLLGTGSLAAADLAKGRATFRSSCASCHAVDNDSNGFGPYLKGVVGRPAASVAGYNYSAAMQQAGRNGLVWDEERLAAFLSSPSKAVPGTRMRFFGFWFSSQIEDVIAYLKANP
ncbi:c-type cytochrome [Rhizobium straminoryzae]|uniref:Cytochrome c family protein n=1 Tax=Rhizobium straminoryzae TaxID=1387186 RepID=A0A549SLK3_9HYPH|nr:cytochrome c family protein [Rhizobium straminoryzae]TRL30513.1 cytochrome c family protein [Rhizobium straminoryzae]